MFTKVFGLFSQVPSTHIKVKVFQFDNILYEKNYGEIEGVEKIKKTGESLKREIFFGEVHFMITKMKQNEL